MVQATPFFAWFKCQNSPWQVAVISVMVHLSFTWFILWKCLKLHLHKTSSRTGHSEDVSELITKVIAMRNSDVYVN